MLDVHPPHQPTHTWKDFFIHIATITVGLLIAVAIEQTVEHIHLRVEVHEAREALARERESNLALFRHDQQNWLRTFSTLRANVVALEYLRSHPGITKSELPTELNWEQFPFIYQHAEWDATVAKGILSHMPPDEANGLQDYYDLLGVIGRQSLTTWDRVNDAARYNIVDPDPTHLSAAELDRQIDLTQIALTAHFEQGYSLARAAEANPNLPQLITYDSLRQLRPTAFDHDPAAMQGPHDRLQTLMKSTPIDPLPAR